MGKSKESSASLQLQANTPRDFEATHPHNISHSIACRCEMSRSDGACIWLLVLVLFGFVILILWLILRPSAPSYAIVDLSIPNLNGTENTTILFGLEVSNPNLGGGVYYSDMNVTMYLFDENAGSMTMPSFYQGHQKTTSLRGGVDAGRRLSEAVVRAVADGTTKLTMGLVTRVRYKTLWWWSKVHGMVEQARVPVGKDGKVGRVKMHRISSRKPKSRTRGKRKSLLLGG